MTDLQIRPAVSVEDQLALAREEIARLTDSLRWVEQMRAQAEGRVEDEKAATAAAEERAQAEEWRADGAEAKLQRVLVEYVVEPATGVVRGISDGVNARDIPDEVIESTAETLMENLEVDPAVDKLAELARGLLTDWAEERR
jgi:hypothetical protein